MQKLKEFENSYYKGIIFDAFDFKDLSREDAIHLFDVKNSSSIRILYTHKNLPPGLIKVWTSNILHSYFSDESVNRHCNILRLIEKYNMLDWSVLKPISLTEVKQLVDVESTSNSDDIIKKTEVIQRFKKCFNSVKLNVLKLKTALFFENFF